MSDKKDLVSNIKGNQRVGALWGFGAGVYKGADVNEMLTWDKEDFVTAGFIRLGWAGSNEGVSTSISEDSETVVGFGNEDIYTESTNFKDELTINWLPTVDPDILRVWFGDASIVTIPGGFRLEVGSSPTNEKTLVVAGVDRKLNNAILFARYASVDKSMSRDWNDATPSAIPVKFKLMSSQEDGGKTHVELYAQPTTVPPVTP